jgi:hypothetical protein
MSQAGVVPWNTSKAVWRHANPAIKVHGTRLAGLGDVLRHTELWRKSDMICRNLARRMNSLVQAAGINIVPSDWNRFYLLLEAQRGSVRPL